MERSSGGLPAPFPVVLLARRPAWRFPTSYLLASTEWLAKEGLRRRADGLFYIDLGFTALGVVLQTLGAILGEVR